jgi:type IV pilus assembly protein PilA
MTKPAFSLGNQSGFTLVELLVVMLVLAVLSAIAIPSFLSQQEKARDANARAGLATSRTAMEIFATEHGGSYESVTAADLVDFEPTLAETTLSVGPVAERTYVIDVVSIDGQTFTAERTPGGAVVLTCTPPGEGGCPTDGAF